MGLTRLLKRVARAALREALAGLDDGSIQTASKDRAIVSIPAAQPVVTAPAGPTPDELVAEIIAPSRSDLDSWMEEQRAIREGHGPPNVMRDPDYDEVIKQTNHGLAVLQTNGRFEQ